MYGTLRRLYSGGALTSYVVPSDEGPHRRYYGITERGRLQLDEARASWSDVLARVLDPALARRGGDRMTTTAGSSEQIEAYLAAVRAALSDLPEDERADLLAEVEASLVEAAGEVDRPIASLGPPEAFAAELALVGRSRRAGRDTCQGRRPRRDPGTRRRVRATGPPYGPSCAPPASSRPPGGSCAASCSSRRVAAATGATRSIAHPWLPHLPSARATVFWVVVAVVASFALGLRTRGKASAAIVIAVLAIDVVAVLAIVPVERHFRDTPSAYALGVPAVEYVTAAPSPGLQLDGRRVENIYPYSRTGTLLHDVLLYDDTGRPITLGLGPDPLRRVTRGVSDQEIANTFPIRYFAPRTYPRRVVNPDASPRVRVPKIVTPSLAP